MNTARQLSHDLADRIALRPDLVRAARATIAFAAPLLVCHWLNRPADGPFIAMAAQTLSLPDLRGAYKVRFTILATMTLVAAGAAMLGAVAAGGILSAMLGMAAIALLAGVWRHLSADYGPSLGVSSALLFLLGLSLPGGLEAGLHLAGLVMLGSAVATVLHLGMWLVRPQHALRYAVAETWVAASDLVASMRPEQKDGDRVAAAERELRVLLDRTFLILGSAKAAHQAALVKHLEEMRREVVHFAMRVLAFNTSLEPLVGLPASARHLPMLDSVLKALGDAARSVAITLIIHRPENVATANVRLRRAQDLIRVLDEEFAGLTEGVDMLQVRATLAEISRVLSQIREQLDGTVGHDVKHLNLRMTLPELGNRSVESLAAWMNTAPEIDPVLVRYSARMAVLTMAAVGVYKAFAIPRGYWIAFTIVVVLQPDYGATRQRAGERMGGTLAGSVLASLLLWIKLPVLWLYGCAATMAFGFAFFLKRQYGVAIFFVTIMLVLITETTGEVHLDFTAGRLLSTVLGGVLALVAARAFWPNWEQAKFSSLLAEGIRANRVYLESMFAALGKAARDPVEPLMAKRRAENANRLVAASLERLMGEPAHRHEKLERATALATYNQRVTRALTVLAVHLPEGKKVEDAKLAAVVDQMLVTVDGLATSVEKEGDEADAVKLDEMLKELELKFAEAGQESNFSGRLIATQLAKTGGELKAMVLALKSGGAGVE